MPRRNFLRTLLSKKSIHKHNAPVSNRSIYRCHVLLLLALCAACQAVPPADSVTRIAFGSCNRSDLPQPLWTPVVAHNPDLWIWTGDIVYGDTEDMSLLAAKYAQQMSNPGYEKLRTTTAIVGTWDDHDFGANDAGAEYPMKAASQQLLLDFLGVAADDPRRNIQGVYSSYTLGDAPRDVKVILLDVRYHREQPGPQADMLGEQQWRWLEQELGDSAAALTLIVSGTQVLPKDHRWERWDAFPAARQRLLDLVESSGKPGVVFLSGDRHFAELSRLEGRGTYPLYEVTASGLTHSWEQMPDEPNSLRIGEYYNGLNFGLIEVLWDAVPEPLLRLQVRDVGDRPRISIEFPLSQLSVAN